MSAIIWDFSLPTTQIIEGDPNDFSMQFASLHQERAEQQFLRDKNTILAGQLCIKTLELDIAHNRLMELSASIESLEQRLANAISELQQYRDKDEAQNRMQQEIWGPLKRSEPDGSWNPAPVLLDSPVLRMSAACPGPPITLSQVLRSLGLHYSGRVVRNLGAIVHDAYVSKHGHPPRPIIYYDGEGQAEKVSCYTEEDRNFIEDVVLGFDLVRRRKEEANLDET